MKFTSAQSAALDWARGISAQLVLVGHAAPPISLGDRSLLLQNLGVAVFFVLSGLLVTHSVMAKGKDCEFRDYLIERGARIFVPYVPAVGFIVLASWLLALGGPIDAATVAGNLLMLEDYPHYPLKDHIAWLPEIDRVGTGRPLWSVAMEWWIYMGAAAIYFAGRLPIWSAMLVVPGALVLGLNTFGGTLGIVWLSGALIAVAIPHLGQQVPWRTIVMVCGAAAAIRLVLAQGNFFDLRFTLLLAACFFTGLKAMETAGWLQKSSGCARFLASYSYTLYLTHYTVMAAISKTLSPGRLQPLVVFVVANIVAIAMWWLFERHYRVVAVLLRNICAVRPAGEATKLSTPADGTR